MKVTGPETDQRNTERSGMSQGSIEGFLDTAQSLETCTGNKGSSSQSLQILTQPGPGGINAESHHFLGPHVAWSFSREKTKCKLLFFSGASPWQSAESRTGISSQSGQRMGTGCQDRGFSTISGNQLFPGLLPSLVDAEGGSG